MSINTNTAHHLVEAAVDAIQSNHDGMADVLDAIPAPIYVTDEAGVITYFNSACVALAGRVPKLGSDKWCVTWKLYTTDGEPLPHDQCPMAVAIREQRPVRDVEAIAERPDGSRVNFIPFPTPLFDADGRLAGAVNLLLDVTEQRKPDYLRKQAERCRRLADGINDRGTVETLALMAAKYEEQALKLAKSEPVAR
jgi:PAS domain-containing protein